jgi:hypothetical protein
MGKVFTLIKWLVFIELMRPGTVRELPPMCWFMKSPTQKVIDEYLSGPSLIMGNYEARYGKKP